MNTFARLLLVATSLCPALIVAGAGWWTRARDLAIACFAVAALASVLCVLLIRAVRTLAATEVLKVDKAARADKNIFPFLFTYVVPLLVPTTLTTLERGTNALGLLTFIVIVFIVLARTKLHDVNPILSILGYHFFDVEAGALGNVLLVTKAPHVTAGRIRAIRLSDYLWLDNSGSDRAAHAAAEGEKTRNGEEASDD